MSGNFDNPVIDREYRRWRKKILAKKDEGEDFRDALSAGEVLRAHFLIAEFFADEKSGLGGMGPRDGSGHLLHSALSRQFAGFGGARKWEGVFKIAATALFGLVKNHPFHDGNKRTALLAVLHLLEKQGYAASGRKIKFENLVVKVSAGRHRREDFYKRLLREKGLSSDDADVVYVASQLNFMTHKAKRSRWTVTYRQLNSLLKAHGFEIKKPRSGQIEIIRMSGEKSVGQAGFPGWTRQVAQGELKKVRRLCNLQEGECDSNAFFNGATGMDFLISEYAAPLRRLADR